MDPQSTLFTAQTFSSLKKQGLAELEEQLSHWLSADFSTAEISELDGEIS
jgi:hypothetical protein